MDYKLFTTFQIKPHVTCFISFKYLMVPVLLSTLIKFLTRHNRSATSVKVSAYLTPYPMVCWVSSENRKHEVKSLMAEAQGTKLSFA